MVCLLQNRLREHLDAWKKIGASETVLKWIDDGVNFDFHTRPNHTRISNPPFSKEHRTFIKSELARLLQEGAIEECSTRPAFILPLNVVPKKQN